MTLGCPRNQTDSDTLSSYLMENGLRPVFDPVFADIVIINTCGFIEDAREESVEAIMEMVSLKEDAGFRLVVIGCLAQRYRHELEREIPELDGIAGIIGNWEELHHAVIGALSSCDKSFSLKKRTFCDTAEMGYAYLKISEGCDRKCSFCAIPQIRGAQKSRKIEDIIEEAEHLAGIGIKEIILIAQDTTAYGFDIYGKPSLGELVLSLDGIDGIEWLRILYMMPEGIDDGLIRSLEGSRRFIPYFDIPFQHASERVLRSMGRLGNMKHYSELLNKIRCIWDNSAVRSEFILGFPNENDNDFAMLADFIEAHRIDWTGLFMFSPEEGTPAFNYKGRVEKETVIKRFNIIVELRERIMTENANCRIGRSFEVITEGPSDIIDDYIAARSMREAPEIDGLIHVRNEQGESRSGAIEKVLITDTIGFDMIGEFIGDERHQMKTI